MRPTISTGDLELRPMPRREDEGLADAPFRIVVIGDFSGRASRGQCDPAGLRSRRIRTVDRDDFETVFEALEVGVRLSLGEDSEPVELRFSEFDDLHPDALVRNAPPFARLRELAARIDDPATFEEVARELAVAPAPEPAAPPAAPAPEAAAPEAGAGLLESALAATEERAAAASPVDELVRELVAPHVLPGEDPRRAPLVGAVEEGRAELLRQILHHPRFQELESRWHALRQLVFELETGASLRIDLFDASADELRGDDAAAALHHRFVEGTVGTPGAARIALVLVAHTFDANADDVALLASLAETARGAGAALAAAGAPSFAGAESLSRHPEVDEWTAAMDDEVEAAWSAFRATPAAEHVALLFPRYLLRMPYGARGASVDMSGFEELVGNGDRHEHYLWGNGAFALAQLFGYAYASGGWDALPVRSGDLEGLPSVVVERDDEQVPLPCAEILLRERGGERIVERGLVPIWSLGGRDAIRVGPVRSAGSEDLRGPWSA